MNVIKKRVIICGSLRLINKCVITITIISNIISHLINLLELYYITYINEEELTVGYIINCKRLVYNNNNNNIK